jgi:hypothetical protein
MMRGIMKKNLILLSIVTFGFAYNGSITGVTYFDFTYKNDASAFNFNRQYFSYAIQMSNDVKFRVIFDAGRINQLDKEDTRIIIFLKKAQLDYKTKWGKAILGLIGTNTYGVQEKNWGYRFIEKSAIDKNGFSSTTDLGIGISREIRDKLNFSIQLVNGEGYKKPQSDKYQKLSVNATYGENNLSKNEGTNLGLAFSSENTIDKPISMLSLYGGLSINGLRICTESDFLIDQNITKNLISLSAAYSINSRIDIFTRYDSIEETNNPTGKYSISGFVYNWGNGFMISPNISTTNYDDEEIFKDFIYRLNFQFKL